MTATFDHCKHLLFDSISASFAFLKGIALNIFEDKKLNINIKLLEEKHHYCETYFAILDGRKQKIGGIGVIGETLLNKLDIAHKHDVDCWTNYKELCRYVVNVYSVHLVYVSFVWDSNRWIYCRMWLPFDLIQLMQ